jgi:diguanylate cyclase (GGDEF)-like protein
VELPVLKVGLNLSEVLCTAITLMAMLALQVAFYGVYLLYGRRKIWLVMNAGIAICTAGIAMDLLDEFYLMRPTARNMLVAIGTAITTGAVIAVLKQLLAAASTDPLTGVYNRRQFVDAFAREASRSERQGRSFSVVFVDVDNLREVNNELGHLQGDSVLRHIADTLRRTARLSDVIARWGGDEFVLLLPEVGHDRASVVATRVSQEMSGLTVPSVKLGVSTGIATFPSDGRTCDQVISEADRRMYLAKAMKRGDAAAGMQ